MTTAHHRPECHHSYAILREEAISDSHKYKMNICTSRVFDRSPRKPEKVRGQIKANRTQRGTKK